MKQQSSIRHRVYNCFLEGLTQRQTCYKLSISYNQVQQLFEHFCKQYDNDLEDRLTQIRTIEKKLFKAIDVYGLNKTEENLKKVESLHGSYCKFLL